MRDYGEANMFVDVRSGSKNAVLISADTTGLPASTGIIRSVRLRPL